MLDYYLDEKVLGSLKPTERVGPFPSVPSGSQSSTKKMEDKGRSDCLLVKNGMILSVRRGRAMVDFQ